MAVTDAGLVMAVVERNIRAYRPFMAVFFTRLIDPLVMMFAYGLAFAGVAVTMGVSIDYRTYMFPGLMGYMLFHTQIIDSTYLPYFRCFHYGLWPAMLMTPLRLWMILAAEQIFNAMKGIAFCLLMLVIGLLFDAVPSVGRFFLMLPVAVVFMLSINALGNLLCATVRSDWDFDFMWPVVATPMLVLSGVFYDMALFPLWVQYLAWIFPLWHFIEVARPIMLGEALTAVTWGHFGLLVFLWLLCSWLAHRQFYRKLYA